VNKFARVTAFLVAAPLVSACSVAGTSNMPRTSYPSTVKLRSVPEWQARHLAKRACAETHDGTAQCEVLIQTSSISPDWTGWGPSDLQAAYDLPSSSRGFGQIVAIVDAYDNPVVASDLATYRSNFGLPAAKFYKYNQKGQQKHYPNVDVGWGVEIDLDVEMVSASCPNCTIYLIEANSSTTLDLEAAEVEAVTLGAHIVSNSWICYRSTSCLKRSKFDTPGVAYLAAAGDQGYNWEGLPMALPNVISVGGTVLSRFGKKYSERVWSGTGSGCAPGVAKPKWQHDPGCSTRTNNDVAAVAWDLAVYDTFGWRGWITVGGTSAASPLLAGVYGLAGNVSTQTTGKKFWTMRASKRAHDLHTISFGNNGSCWTSYLCIAGTGQFGVFSGPTGWGTPNGLGAF
jgi:subtilase family serine protease